MQPRTAGRQPWIRISGNWAALSGIFDAQVAMFLHGERYDLGAHICLSRNPLGWWYREPVVEGYLILVSEQPIENG
jgi:hypothetical protein